jgi:alkyldihydroxyacetonephosphate synthase
MVDSDARNGVLAMADVVAALGKELGDRLRTDPETLTSHRRDTWVLSELHDLEGRPGPLPLAVVEARSAEDVSRALAVCREARVPVVPFGGGSGVCGGIVVPEGAVVLSTGGIRGLRELDAGSLTASFGAGTNGMEAERAVEKEGLTIGHWPQSIELSTVGGWVATRASGQYSTAYGNIEDLLLDIEVVLPDGSVLRTRRTPRASAGPDLRQLFLGSEGTLGVITEVTFSLRPLPGARRGQAFHYPDFAAGLEPVRLLMREGWRPPVVRLYDAAETARLFPGACPDGRALLLMLHEGPETGVAAEAAGVEAICRGSGGVPVGAPVVDTWLKERNHVPGFRGFLEKGIILDTIEVACTWDRAAALYRRARESLAEVPGILLASAHSSHSYRSGTNLYITFVARPEKREDMSATYRECWRRTMAAALELGAGIAHHHGIGRVRRDVLAGEIGETGVALLRSVKRALDPDGLLNPGVLIPDESRAAPAR